MDRNAAAERALLGFLSFGGLAYVFSNNWLAIAACCVAGGLSHFGYFALRPYPFKRLFQDKTSACVSVTPKLYFREVSAKAPEKMGFIRVQDVDRKELFGRLAGKMLNQDTIPFHMRVAIEEKRSLSLPWEAIEPHLKVVPVSQKDM